MATLQTFARHCSKILRNTGHFRCQNVVCRSISTSDKNKDLPVRASTEPMIDRSEELQRLEEHFADADPTKIKVHIVYMHGYALETRN